MRRRPLSAVEHRNWPRLSSTENVGAITFCHLLQRYGTATTALEAVPGSPLDRRCAGTNDLLRQGAVLTESTHDVLTPIQGLPAYMAEPSAPGIEGFSGPCDEDQLASAREIILENLGPSPISIDELIRECQLSAPLVLTVLFKFELAGRLERQPGHKIALIADIRPGQKAVGE
jgi:predicted Rossmann fold nucleotide-binding protein DprA/Smf involved in DNA uptake